MSQSTCDNCRAAFASCFCSCFYPVSRLCPNCSSKHEPEPLHYRLPISQVAFVQSQESYEVFLVRLTKLNEARAVLTRDVNQIAVWKARLQNPAIDESVRTHNSQYLETLHRLLQPIFDSSLEDVKNNIVDDNYQPLDDIKMAIWAFVINANLQFFSLLENVEEAESQLGTFSFHVTVLSLIPSLRQYRQTSKQNYGAPVVRKLPEPRQDSSEILYDDLESKAFTGRGVERSDDEVRKYHDIRAGAVDISKRMIDMETRRRLAESEVMMQMEVARQRMDAIDAESLRREIENRKEAVKLQKEAVKQQKEAENLQKEAKKPKNAQHSSQNEWKKSFAASCDYRSVCFTLCGCCICWPCIGCFQCLTIRRLLEEDYICIGVCASFWGPTLLCCIGAALNRTFIRKKKGIDGHCIVDLLLYCLHVFNCCLLIQELEEVKDI